MEVENAGESLLDSARMDVTEQQNQECVLDGWSSQGQKSVTGKHLAGTGSNGGI